MIVQDAMNRAIATEMEQHSHDHLVNLAGGSVFTGHGMCTRNPYLFTGGPDRGLWRFGYPNQQGQARHRESDPRPGARACANQAQIRRPGQ